MTETHDPKLALHRKTLEERDKRIAALEEEIKENPGAEWVQTTLLTKDKQVLVPQKAVIETRALVDDIKNHRPEFREGFEWLNDHGEIISHPRTLGYANQLIFDVSVDEELIEDKILVQLGMSYCEGKLKELKYDFSNVRVQTFLNNYKSLDSAFVELHTIDPQ